MDMFPLTFNVKTATAGYKNRATSLVHPWLCALCFQLGTPGPWTMFSWIWEVQGSCRFLDFARNVGLGRVCEPEERVW